jgi:hypothetical protein
LPNGWFRASADAPDVRVRQACAMIRAEAQRKEA